MGRKPRAHSLQDRRKIPPCTKRILEQGRTNGLKFTSDCPTLVVYLRINWGGSMTISYPNQSHTNLSRSSTYNDQDINSRSMFYNKIIKNNLKKKLPMSQKDCLVICTTRNWGSKSNISTPNLLYQEVFRQHNFQGCFKVVVVFHLKSHTYNYSSNDQQTLILPT